MAKAFNEDPRSNFRHLAGFENLDPFSNSAPKRLIQGDGKETPITIGLDKIWVNGVEVGGGGGGVLEYATMANLPATGEAGVIYVVKNLDTDFKFKTLYWAGSPHGYVSVGDGVGLQLMDVGTDEDKTSSSPSAPTFARVTEEGNRIEMYTGSPFSPYDPAQWKVISNDDVEGVLPPGGSAGKILKKASGGDFDVVWGDAPGGSDLNAARIIPVTPEEKGYADCIEKPGCLIFRLGNSADENMMISYDYMFAPTLFIGDVPYRTGIYPDNGPGTGLSYLPFGIIQVRDSSFYLTLYTYAEASLTPIDGKTFYTQSGIPLAPGKFNYLELIGWSVGPSTDVTEFFDAGGSWLSFGQNGGAPISFDSTEAKWAKPAQVNVRLGIFEQNASAIAFLEMLILSLDARVTADEADPDPDAWTVFRRYVNFYTLIPDASYLSAETQDAITRLTAAGCVFLFSTYYF